MSGIAGVYLKPSTEAVERMLAKLAHRGPDGQGIKNLPGGTLGHRRLAILDIGGGHQPMGIDNTWIAFNGAIYNYRELAREYLQSESLTTHSDTEVILHLYRKFGPRCVEMLDGMFAFAILDSNGLFLARDPLGIKPMYCSERDGAFYFASELKALVEITSTVHEFPAGYWFHSRGGWHSYFEVHKLQVENSMNSPEVIRSTLKEAVRKRLIADVPVGVCLSGDLDSSIIAMLANQELAQIHSFAVGMEGSEELAAARKLAKTLRTNHHERIYTEDEIQAVLPKLIYHLESFDPLLVRSAVPNFFLAERASKYVKVIISGEGAEELYAGYDYFGSIKSPGELQDKTIDLIATLHNTNLQRADRISMAFGLETRTPFLDIKSVGLGLEPPSKKKIYRNRPAKNLWREAFRDDLPQDIINRPKQKLPMGAGSLNVVIEAAERDISDHEFRLEQSRLLNRWGYRLPNKEALYYYKLLRHHFQDRSILPTLGRSQGL
jgi:asparagine synthase (glutamine-hydrolysing)